MYRDQDNGWFSEIYLDTDKRQNTIYFDEKKKTEDKQFKLHSFTYVYLFTHVYRGGGGDGQNKMNTVEYSYMLLQVGYAVVFLLIWCDISIFSRYSCCLLHI